MKLIQIENKIYKVPKKVHERLQELREEAFEHFCWEKLSEYCKGIERGIVYGARYLGDVEFDYSELPF